MSTSQTTQKSVQSDNTIPVQDETITNEKCSSFDSFPLDTENVTLKKEIKDESIAIRKSLITGHPEEFKDEVLNSCSIDFFSM